MSLPHKKTLDNCQASELIAKVHGTDPKDFVNRTIFKTDTIGSDTLDKVTLRARAAVLACEGSF